MRPGFRHWAFNHDFIAGLERPRSCKYLDRPASRSLNERLLRFRVSLHIIALFLKAVAFGPVLHRRGVATHSSTGGTRFWYATYHLEHSIIHRCRFTVPIAKAMADDDLEMFQYSTFLVHCRTLTA
jgi:hypothetical protein